MHPRRCWSARSTVAVAVVIRGRLSNYPKTPQLAAYRHARTIRTAGTSCPGIGQDETGLVSEKRLRVGLVAEPEGIDNPYNHGAYLGLERAVRELDMRGRVLTPAPKEGYVPSLSLFARQKYDLVIGFGFFAAAAIDRVATGFPETRFAIIDFA